MDITRLIGDALQEVFQTMIPLELSKGTREVDLSESAVFHVSGMIGISGQYQGMLAVHTTRTVAEAITSAFLMLEPGEAVEDADLKDAVGEMINMTAGGFKSSLAEHGVEVSIAVPTTIAGRSYTVNCLAEARRVMLPFHLEAGELTVEFKYKETA